MTGTGLTAFAVPTCRAGIRRSAPPGCRAATTVMHTGRPCRPVHLIRAADHSPGTRPSEGGRTQHAAA